jgi:hypothetical protein
VSIADIIREASGGRARVMDGKDALDVLLRLLAEPEGTGLPEDLLKATNCENPDCELHGHLNRAKADDAPYQITGEQLEAITSDDAFTHMISATASSHNALMLRKHEQAALMQKQATLWQTVAEYLRGKEVSVRLGDSPQPDAQVVGYVQPQDNLDLDKPLRTGE